MKKIEIAQRLRIYLKYLGYYTLGAGGACALGDFIMASNRGLGVLIGFVGSVILFYMLHLTIGASLITRSFRNKIVVLLPIVAVSTALVALKIYVNEFNSLGGHPLISQKGRILDYFLFSIWTTVVLWEFYYILLAKLKTKTT